MSDRSRSNKAWLRVLIFGYRLMPLGSEGIMQVGDLELVLSFGLSPSRRTKFARDLIGLSGSLCRGKMDKGASKVVFQFDGEAPARLERCRVSAYGSDFPALDKVEFTKRIAEEVGRVLSLVLAADAPNAPRIFVPTN